MADVADSKELGATADRFMVQAGEELPTAQDLRATERVMIRFEGAGSGVEGLSWGQVGLWDAMQRQRSWFPISAVSSLPSGTTVADVAGQLRFMMGRFPTLRTRLRFDPDEPKQVVSAAGEIFLEIFDAPDDADPARLAAHIVRRYSEADYDFVTEWPVRMAVVRHRGTLSHRVIVMCHLATDGLGAGVMVSELAGRDPATGRATRPVTAVDPLEQARWQRSPAGARQSDAALRYCERLLRAVSPRRFPEPTGKPQPRYWYASFTSPAMYLAVRAIAARTRMDSATVLLAIFAMAQVRVTGINPMMILVLVSNRYRRGLAETVSPVTQAVPCAIDVADATVDEVVARTRGRVLAAYKHGYFDPLRFNELVARVSRERGEEVDTGCYFNDRRIRHREVPAGPPPTPEQVDAALSRTAFEWKLKQDEEPYERFFLHVEDVPDTVAISVVLDTHHVWPTDVESCLRGMEKVAVAAITSEI